MNDYFEFEGLTEDLLLNENRNNNLKEKEVENKHSFSAGLIVKAIGEVTQGAGNIAQAIATRKEAEAKIKEIGGKRQAQLNDCETNKAFKKFLDAKYRRNRIKECQDEVKKRLDAEENEQKEIVRRMTAIEEGKIASDVEKSKSVIDEKKSSKKLYVVGGIIALGLILGTIIYIKTKK